MNTYAQNKVENDEITCRNIAEDGIGKYNPYREY